MKVFNYSVLIAALLTVSVNFAHAREYLGQKSNSGSKGVKAKAAGCSPAQTLTEFYVNNVRTAAETGGNTWYDRGNSQGYYEVPAGEGNNAIYAGALWMGGEDPAGNLKLAAITFRADGNDYWPGPLTTDGSASIEPATCIKWDRFFLVNRQMVETHRYYFTLLSQGIDPSTDPVFENGYVIPQEILNWPAHGETILGQSYLLAPFADLRDPVTGEILTEPGLYEPELGDYPLYDLDQEIDCRTRLVTDPVPLFGDFTQYWIFNDKGNVHTESQGEPIGMEIQAQMFGFTTNDEINNMTFCNYVLINRGSLTLKNTFFAQWVDTDLGKPDDDYVGCDVTRGLGYSYNGDNNDESSASGPGYGIQPPAIGIDFFEGPYQDPDGINNEYGIGDGQALNGLGYHNLADSTSALGVDSIIDNERFGMRRFLYYNIGGGPTGDPHIAVEYYNYMRGIWGNNVPMRFGGTGYNPACQSCAQADFMFPGDTDPLNWGTDGVDPGYAATGGWTEENEGNPPGDRRFLQSAGPFTLDPGEFNNITVGVVYARAATGGPFASVVSLRSADDKAQALFENCFRLLDGPDAPDLTAQELDKEIILYLRNTSPLSNNQGEKYIELDPTIPPTKSDSARTPNDQYYRFQGYQVFQLKNSGVSVSEIEDPDKARLVFQSDIRDFDSNGQPIGQIINYEFQQNIGLPAPKEKVNGANEGIGHSVKIVKDEFAAGDTRLINFKKYYYIAVAYGYNNYEEYDPRLNNLTGQAFPYLRGRSGASGDIQPITVIPHIPAPEQNGTVFTSEYGDGVPITRVEGAGNGGNDLELNTETVDAIMDEAPYKADRLTYLPGKGPITVKVVDPLNVKAAKFDLKFYNQIDPNGGYRGDFNDARWYMLDLNKPTDTIFSENTIRIANEQIIPEYGISVSIGQYEYDVVNRDSKLDLRAYYPRILGNGIQFTSGVDGWFSGVADQEGNNFFNWIRSGIIAETRDPSSSSPCFLLPDGSIDPYVFNDEKNFDDNQLFEKVVGGTFAPARLVAGYDCGPTPLSADAAAAIKNESRDLSNVTSVDLFITQNKDRWSRCPVYEMQPEVAFAQLHKKKMELRGALSVDKNGRNQLDPDANQAECTYNGQQVMTQADIDAMSSSELSAFLLDVSSEYPSITTASQLVGLSFGMGWFPGYAISPETGERLNVGFGENSYFAGDNGRDMLWNPSTRIATQLGNQLVFGGEHYIYTFRDRLRENALTGARYEEAAPMYDGGQTTYTSMNSGSVTTIKRSYRSIGWVGFPLLAQGFKFLSPEDGLVPGNVKITAHVAQPYQPYATTRDELGAASFPFTLPSNDYDLSSSFWSSFPYALPTVNYDLSTNYWYPAYTFTTSGIETSTQVIPEGIAALELIDIVPNPYYGYSAYEQSRVDNEVKFVNLPPKCKIQIFSINGTLVRVFEKDDASTYLNWNLQNEKFIPVSGGIYLIHVQAPGLGERVIKFFCATRPTDLRNF